MAADGGNEIDLYAEDLEHEFNQDNEFNDQNVDLYDDVIAPSGQKSGQNDGDDYGMSQDGSNSDATNDVQNSSSMDNSQGSAKKISIYVGNLTWWTSDTDVTEAINGLGVTDVFEVKFFENRANGQSKGFCVVNLGSDASVRNVIENLPKHELHGQAPVVTPCNRQSLNHFEMQSRKMTPGNAGGPPNHNGAAGNGQPPPGPRPFGGPMGMRPPLIARPNRPNGPLLPGQPRMPMHGQGGPYQNQPWGQGGQHHGGPRPPGHMHPGGPRPNMPLMGMPPRSRGPVPGQSPLLRNPGPPPMEHPRPQHPPPPMQEWNDHSGHHGHPNNMPPNQPNPSVPQRPPGMPPVGGHGQGPAPHVNPAFFQNQHQGPQPNDMYNRMNNTTNQYHGGGGDYNRHMGGGDGPGIGGQISDIEFEEIMNKNRSISSGAISRAVSDAAAGDYGIAIETLTTAIALIKQSKVSGDERCKILISSLEDTLQGIETKSYGRRERQRSRDRERSREHSSRRDKPSRRDRSRSRERDYRERSRDRDRYHDRYHDERSYREKERERDRDRERDHRRH